MEKRYFSVDFIRKAIRKNSVVFLNPHSGDTIEMDNNSRDIFGYIIKNNPTKAEIMEYARNYKVEYDEVAGYISCLEEIGLIYEA